MKASDISEQSQMFLLMLITDLLGLDFQL